MPDETKSPAGSPAPSATPSIPAGYRPRVGSPDQPHLPSIICEVRHTKTEDIAWLDRASGRSMKGKIHTMFCEAGDMPFSISVNLPEGLMEIPPLPKGTKILAYLRQWETGKEGRKARCDLSQIVIL